MGSLIAPEDIRLRQRALPVGRVRKADRDLFDRLIATMDAAPGIGLAAPQVGFLRRMLVMRVPGHSVCLMADPVIVSASASMDLGDEGCLSFPDTYLKVLRHSRVRVEFKDYHNERRLGEFTGLAATCVQHEIDHLDGVLFHMRAHDTTMNARASNERYEVCP